MSTNLLKRILFAVVAIPAVLALIWYGGYPLAIMVAIAGVLGTREVYDLARRQRIEPAQELGLVMVLVFAPAGYLALSAMWESWWMLVAGFYAGAVWVMLVLVWALWKRPPGQKPLAASAITVFGVVYAGLLPAFIVILRHSGGYGIRSLEGTALVFFPLIVTWVCDTAAMFGGMAFKGPRFAPVVSPGKTWSGTVSGIVGGLAAAPLYNALVFQPLGFEFPVWKLLVCAGLWSVVGQIGDLAESLLKREAGVKDSSSLIPGHGGVLDRLDSLYFVLPTAVALYRLLGIR